MLPAYIIVPDAEEIPGMTGRDFLHSVIIQIRLGHKNVHFKNVRAYSGQASKAAKFNLINFFLHVSNIIQISAKRYVKM